MDEPGKLLASPCVRNCCLDEGDVCMGCGRHIDEILAWQQASNQEREEIILLAHQRLELRAARHRALKS
ncbi:MAG: DUF1289 domain-containing protein [Methylococcales bacterium]